MYSLLFVSLCQIPETRRSTEVEAILASAARKNAALSLSGGLIFTGTHFALLLEGERVHIKNMMAAIKADVRHSELSVVSEGPIAQRSLRTWKLAYYGNASYVSKRVDRCWSHAEAYEVAELRALIVEFVQKA